jgi:hypothetical protein
VSQRDKSLDKQLLLEKIALAGIARALDVSQMGLQTDIRDLYASCPDDLNADLPDPASMQADWEDKLDDYACKIAALKNADSFEPRRVGEEDIETFEQDLALYFGKRNQRYFDE